MKIHYALIALVIMIGIFVVPAVTATTISPGNHYSGLDIGQENRVKVVEPPKDQNEINSLTSGMLYISVKTAGCMDLAARQVSIAPFDAEPVINAELGVNGRYDVRLPAGMYEVVLPVGQGSDVNFPNTWKQETQTVTIIPGGTYYMTFIGAGQACGTPDVPLPETIDNATVSGHLHKVTIWYWVYVDGVHLFIDNPNDVPVRVDVTAVLTGKQPFVPFAPKIVTKTGTYIAPSGASTQYMPVADLFFGTPTTSITSVTSPV